VPNFEGGVDWLTLGLLTLSVLLVNWLVRLLAVQVRVISVEETVLCV
jgi:hypothetical protein